MRDYGLTFGTNARTGVCVHFHEKVGGVGFRKHSALTVTVADLEGLTRALGQAGLSAAARDQPIALRTQAFVRERVV